MAKVQVKKAAAAAKGGRKSAVRKVVARAKSAVRRTAVKRASKPPKPVKKAAKPAPKKATKPAPKPVAKAKTIAKAVKKVAKAVVAKVTPIKPAPPAPKPVAAALPAPPPTPMRPIARPVVEADKKRVRRPRTRVQSNGAPAAAWLSTTKPRPASFIPAPPRAEAPSAIAAPPASSDRLIRPEDVSDIAVRTVPVRVDIEQGGGKFYLSVIPQELSLRPGEGIEWDFRYIGGADITVGELIIEIDKPSPFQQAVFRSKKPGAARPHRQLSGATQASAVGRRIEYSIVAMTPFKTEMAKSRASFTVVA